MSGFKDFLSGMSFFQKSGSFTSMCALDDASADINAAFEKEDLFSSELGSPGTTIVLDLSNILSMSSSSYLSFPVSSNAPYAPYFSNCSTSFFFRGGASPPFADAELTDFIL